MTNSQELFGEQDVTPSQEEVSDQKPTEESVEQPSLVDELVGEGKKFSDVNSLAKSKLDADAHIKRIEEENAALRAAKEKAEKTAENTYGAILQKLEEKKSISVPDNKDVHNDKSSPQQEVNLEAVVAKVIEQQRVQATESSNIEQAKTLIAQEYGSWDTAKSVVDEFLENKPYMKDAVRQLLKTDPETFVKEVKAYKAPSMVGNSSTDPVSNLKNINFEDEGVITWDEVRKVMKKDLKRYNSPEFQAMINKSRDFFNKKGIEYSTTK